eukprot:1564069-Pleurochrysis_carterae.AAC.1
MNRRGEEGRDGVRGAALAVGAGRGFGLRLLARARCLRVSEKREGRAVAGGRTSGERVGDGEEESRGNAEKGESQERQRRKRPEREGSSINLNVRSAPLHAQK